MKKGDEVAFSIHETQSSQSSKSSQLNRKFRVGLYGWRKRCLYLLILGLLIMVVINLSLTLWVLKVMEFSTVSVTHFVFILHTFNQHAICRLTSLTHLHVRLG